MITHALISDRCKKEIVIHALQKTFLNLCGSRLSCLDASLVSLIICRQEIKLFEFTKLLPSQGTDTKNFQNCFLSFWKVKHHLKIIIFEYIQVSYKTMSLEHNGIISRMWLKIMSLKYLIAINSKLGKEINFQKHNLLSQKLKTWVYKEK